ncbi:DUF2786 domain-containing protein [Streptomyces sp. NPDC101206]|uniref:DUF2786 domain-containing protein n=1 Tax=Streptomyces sp. NPDC101206 TaxID=3366128 RepID=UPI00381614EF
MQNAGPRLYELLPTDLGDGRLVAAVAVARLAADVARAQPVAESAVWLERLVPGADPHDLERAVRELRSRIAWCGEPALWSWNARGWEEMLLWWWRRHQPRTGDQVRDFAVWRARWSADIPWNGAIDHPEQAPHAHGRELVTPAEFFSGEPEPLRFLAQAVLNGSDGVAAVQDSVLLREEHLQGAGHLEWLAEQQARVEQLEAWRRRQQEGGSEATRAFLGELSKAGDRYVLLVLQPVIDALSQCERALLADSRHGASRSAADYLEAFLDSQEQPGADGWDDRRLSADVQRVAREHSGRGEVTWHDMSGTVPVWYHIVTSREERAAALAYSGKPTPSVVRVVTGEETPGDPLGLFDDPWAETDEWYPEPGIEVHYDPDSVADLCALLAACQLGQVRLEFLIPQADGGFRQLRSLRTHIRSDDAVAWRRWALGRLAEVVPEPEDLAEALAQEQGGDGADDGEEWDDWDWGVPPPRSEARPAPEPPAPRRTSDRGLPEALLEKVRALLRKAESPAASEEEARAYLAKATELMAKYGIQQAMLDKTAEHSGPVDRIIELCPPYVKEVRRLLSWISHEMRCRSVYPGGKANGHRVHLFGFEADIQASEVLFASLRLQMLDGADRADRLHRPVGEDVRAYKRSWMLGFIREVTARVGAAQQAARTDAERGAGAGAGPENGARSVALVLADRTRVVESSLATKYPRLKKQNPTTFKGTGYRQGVADGRYADIGAPAFGEGERFV